MRTRLTTAWRASCSLLVTLLFSPIQLIFLSFSFLPGRIQIDKLSLEFIRSSRLPSLIDSSACKKKFDEGVTDLVARNKAAVQHFTNALSFLTKPGDSADADKQRIYAHWWVALHNNLATAYAVAENWNEAQNWINKAAGYIDSQPNLVSDSIKASIKENKRRIDHKIKSL